MNEHRRPIDRAETDNQGKGVVRACPDCDSTKVRLRKPCSVIEDKPKAGTYYCKECKEQKEDIIHRERRNKDYMTPERILRNLGVDIDDLK